MIPRPMESGDVAFLTDLWVASWHDALPEIDFEARRGWLAAVLETSGHTTLVAAGHQGPLGFATFEIGYLHQLVVAPSEKGRGVATRLLAEVKALSPSGLALDVNQANPRAIRFYQREGFRIESAGTNPASGLATWRLRWPGDDTSGP